MEKEIKLYHFFAWSNAWGWQHLGSSNGYSTFEECKKANVNYIAKGTSGRDEWKIMKLVEVE